MRTALAALALAILAAPARPAPEPLHAVCTVAMVADIVENVGGERVRVETLIGPGVDPHLFKATRDDIARLLKADVVFYNGLTLEGKMTDALVKVARSGRPVYAVAEGVPEGFLLEPESLDGHYDPHVWMDPVGWSHAADAVVRALSELDPTHAPAYADRGRQYQQRLADLDAYARRALDSIPPDRRVLVTSHDAFNYFGRRYSIEVLGIQGISTVSEAGLGDIENIVAQLVSRKVPAVFPETTVSDKNIRALIEGAARSGHAVVIGGRLFSDAMGPPGTYEGTYIGMIDHNVTTIARALGGQAPDRGMNGKLGHDPR